MKSIKKILSIIFAAALCLCSAAIFGCSYPDIGDLSREEVKNIFYDFFDQYDRENWESTYGDSLEKVTVNKCLGRIGEYTVLEMDNRAYRAEGEWKLIIDGLEVLASPDLAFDYIVYKQAAGNEGQIMGLREAYEMEAISRDDLQQIAEWYREIEKGQTALTDELNEEEKTAIIRRYYESKNRYYHFVDVSLYYISIDYYGTYNGVKAFGTSVSGYWVVGETKIGGVRFITPNTGYIYMVYIEAEEGGRGGIMKLDDAYKNRAVKRSDLKQIAHFANNSEGKMYDARYYQ